MIAKIGQGFDLLRTAVTQKLVAGTSDNRRTKESESIESCFIVKDLLDRDVDAFYVCLHMSDLDTLLNLRLVSKAIYKLSIYRSYCLSPLMCKALIPFEIKDLAAGHEEKLRFASEYASLNISSVDINYINNSNDLFNRLLSLNIDIEKENLGLTFIVKDITELNQLDSFLLSDTLSEQQSLIRLKIKGLNFKFKVNEKDASSIKNLLNLFVVSSHDAQLIKLSFEDIASRLTRPRLPDLKTLVIDSISFEAVLNFPKFPNLTTFVINSTNNNDKLVGSVPKSLK